MPLDYTICTATFGNGAPILGMKIILVRQMMAVFGSRAEILNTGCCAEVRGTTIPGIVAVPFVTGSGWSVGIGTTGFVLFPSRLRGLSSPLSFSPLALYPSFFFSLLPFSRVSAFKIFFFRGRVLLENCVNPQ
jgi:hypothetical protein